MTLLRPDNTYGCYKFDLISIMGQFCAFENQEYRPELQQSSIIHCRAGQSTNQNRLDEKPWRRREPSQPGLRNGRGSWRGEDPGPGPGPTPRGPSLASTVPRHDGRPRNGRPVFSMESPVQLAIAVGKCCFHAWFRCKTALTGIAGLLRNSRFEALRCTSSRSNPPMLAGDGPPPGPKEGRAKGVTPPPKRSLCRTLKELLLSGA